MTRQERDYEAILSRVLHTTTDQLEPVGDGLTKIRARLGEPWLKRQWWLLRNEFMVLRWFVVVRCESLFSRIRSRSDVTDLAPDASAAEEADGGALKSLLSMATSVSGKNKKQQRSAGPAMAWLRPALAVAGAVVLVVAGVFALGNIQQGFGFIGFGADGGGSQPGTSSQNAGPGNPNGTGSAVPGQRSGSAAPDRSGAAKQGAATSQSKAGASPTPCPPASPSAQNSPTPTPTPTSTPTATPTPTVTPTSTPTATSSPTTSQAPLTSGVPGPTQKPIGTTALVLCGQAPASPSPANQAPSGT